MATGQRDVEIAGKRHMRVMDDRVKEEQAVAREIRDFVRNTIDHMADSDSTFSQRLRRTSEEFDALQSCCYHPTLQVHGVIKASVKPKQKKGDSALAHQIGSYFRLLSSFHHHFFFKK
ncbi:hypothetical protein L1049_010206 [Liquidambar formosana]|uniref:Uncharacterized protein n=1 Tax=Liquidambar formosana TaxID=63359 RepID=A0AAP0N8W1_LIQFO